MRRELPRTLFSLSASYQREIRRRDYEIVLVDNGSQRPWRRSDLAHLDADIELIRVRDADPSPVRAVNLGLKRARGSVIGVCIDGARMVTPGLLSACRQASGLHARPVVAVMGFHLGRESQAASVRRGYTAEAEDRLLDAVRWPSDGYRLFEISVFSDSCVNGWFRPLAESNALFLPAAMWAELGGYDPAFRSAGGGLANLDAYERALALCGAQSVVVLGEGTFHQVHGGVATNSPRSRWREWCDEYRTIRGRDYRVPAVDSTYFGRMPEAACRHLAVGVSPWRDAAVTEGSGE
jgi:hypothetical protein